MQKLKNKTMATLITLILMLTIGSVLLPSINTAKATTATFYPYIYVAPNPIGVGQSVNVGFGFTMPTQDPYYYSGWILTVTNPSGVNQTLGPFTSDSTGGTGISFTPDAVGTWYFQVSYPAGTNVTYIAKGSVPAATYTVPSAMSQQVSLTVQQEPLSYPPTIPLPTNYWQYPIYSDNAQWYNISGNWLMSGYDTLRSRTGAVSGVFDPYTTVPKSAHILWTEPWMFGGVASVTSGTTTGLAKGYSGVQTYYTGSNYREVVTPPIIINGRLYYNQVDPPAYGFYCVDLYTGQTIWFQNQTFLSGTGSVVSGSTAQLSLGQVVTQNGEMQNGATPYLWSISGTTWARYDAYSGNLLNTIVNATGVSTTPSNLAAMFSPNGELLVYYFTQSNANSYTGNLALWNSTRVVLATYNQAQSLNIAWKNGIQWNVTVPACPNEGADQGDITWDPKNPTMLIISNMSNGNPNACGPFTDIAYSTTDGHELWSQTRNTAAGDIWENVYTQRVMGDGIYMIMRKETRQIYAFNAATGDQMWVSDPRTNALGTFAGGSMFAYGKIYVFAYDGTIYAYDEQTGKTVWTWNDSSVNPSGLEVPYGQYPFYGSMVAADGILLAHNQEHTEQSPLFRGEDMYAINASTGQTIWMIKGQFKETTVAGGIIVAPNLLDGQIYAFGKGPSAMTVTAPDVGVTTSTPVTITGTVMDVSAGTQQTAVAANFPNGLPCVSDASQSAWMEYAYEQQPKPTNATGVPVSIDVIDSNGNYRNIGTTTSDASGTFGFTWTPDITGSYTVIASFAGSGSYYGSSAQTYFYASSPAPTASPYPVVNLPPTETYFIISTVAIIIAIAIIGALIMLMLRKRP